METVAYIGYLALIALAAIWTIGVRVKLDAGVPTILGALFFLAGAIAIGISGANRLHSFWIIATGFILTIAMAYLGAQLPQLFAPMRLLSSLFARIVRIGIPADRIKAAQGARLNVSGEVKVPFSEEALTTLVLAHKDVFSEIESRDTVFRRKFDDQKRRSTLPWIALGRGDLEEEEYELWVQLDSGKINASQAIELMTNLMERYYGRQYPLR